MRIISGGEPTLCRDHLFSLLDLVKDKDYLFILETNGILLGADKEYVEKLTKYRISLSSHDLQA